MNLSKVLTAMNFKGLTIEHLEDNTSLDPNRDSIVYRTDGGKPRVITKDQLILKLLKWAFKKGYMLSLYMDTDGSFVESDYTCSVAFIPFSCPPD